MSKAPLGLNKRRKNRKQLMSLCPRTRGTHHSNQPTQSLLATRNVWDVNVVACGDERNKYGLVHKTLSMGGKCMLDNNGQSQYAQYDARP